MAEILALTRASCGELLRAEVVAFRAGALPRPTWGERAQLEENSDFLQVVPYAVLQCERGGFWSYRRDGGENRLDGRLSIGVGGHVERADESGELLATARSALLRELNEELAEPPAAVPRDPLAWINEQDSPVGRVHIGLVWVIPWPGSVPPRPRESESLSAVGFVEPDGVCESAGYEKWSVLAAQSAKAWA